MMTCAIGSIVVVPRAERDEDSDIRGHRRHHAQRWVRRRQEVRNARWFEIEASIASARRIANGVQIWPKDP